MYTASDSVVGTPVPTGVMRLLTFSGVPGFVGDVYLHLISNGHGVVSLFSTDGYPTVGDPARGWPSATFNLVGTTPFDAIGSVATYFPVREFVTSFAWTVDAYTEDVAPTGGNVDGVYCQLVGAPISFTING